MGRRARNYLPPSPAIFRVKVENMTKLGGKIAFEKGINVHLDYLIRKIEKFTPEWGFKNGTFKLGNRVTGNKKTEIQLEIEATQIPYQFNFRVTEHPQKYELLSGYITNETEKEKIIYEACAKLTSTGGF